jgi:ParB/RepB/Spo0J family partition protein
MNINDSSNAGGEEVVHATGDASVSIVEIDLELISPRAGARGVVLDRVSKLAESIKDIGLQCPIIIRITNSGAMEIVAGWHRFEAFRLLGKKSIPSIIRNVSDLEAELIQIDENLCREDLTPAQMAAAITRRKQIYEALHPETSAGGDRKSTRQIGDLKKTAKHKRFTKVTAEATGRPERSVQRAARRGRRIGHKNLDRIAKSSLDRPGELDALAALPMAQRDALIEKAAKGEIVSARELRSEASSENWRGEFRRLMNKVRNSADRTWASQELGTTSGAGDIPDFLVRDPEARIDAVIRDLGAMRVAEGAAMRLSPDERAQLSDRLSSDAPATFP